MESKSIRVQTWSTYPKSHSRYDKLWVFLPLVYLNNVIQTDLCCSSYFENYLFTNLLIFTMISRWICTIVWQGYTPVVDVVSLILRWLFLVPSLCACCSAWSHSKKYHKHFKRYNPLQLTLSKCMCIDWNVCSSRVWFPSTARTMSLPLQLCWEGAGRGMKHDSDIQDPVWTAVSAPRPQPTHIRLNTEPWETGWKPC